mmetsp:Transcript_20387/g.30235  ORF Transcript_20387/g.30235 Transcript_20387/m.30235 type:complete len:145 (+) Transcript_20387:277-711(+)
MKFIAFTAFALLASISNAEATEEPPSALRGSWSSEVEELLRYRNVSAADCVKDCECPGGGCTFEMCTEDCECDGGGCSMPVCVTGCECDGGNCDMPACTYECECDGGNCKMNACTNDCDCDARDCEMTSCKYDCDSFDFDVAQV